MKIDLIFLYGIMIVANMVVVLIMLKVFYAFVNGIKYR